MSKNSLEFHGNQIEQLGHQMPGPDNSLIRLNSGSHQGVSKMSKDSLPEQQTLARSGDCSSYREQEGVQVRSALSGGKAEGTLPSSQVDYSQFASLPYPYSAPFYGGVLTPYGTPNIIHADMVGVAPSARILPPLEPAAEPIYVNPKQYNAIVRRRQKKAKLEAENKAVKTRKPYLHESRHLHALKRERGSGGRFLNKKQQQQQEDRSPNNNPLTETPNSSDITTVCTSGGLSNPQEHRSFSSPGFSTSHARGGNTHGGNNHGPS
ncbi:nuclear transcription factor Y subunit A-4-like [Ananas comosus]|uniref:Nuclear transcription factor Y subunit n=1 Tax=Ananas comosus TaxID=4615 RepID=A0A6P5GJA1_ANACO|nr:nuclear transcription factor Y subunit A-4-like [Ananas comosus]XP_020106182.1 nuclear transcription factor Y subunit A-4-like [Ananas comosus]